MKTQSIGLLFCLAGLPAAAQTTALPTIRVSSEVAPPGGMAQMKVLLTSPKPITSGNMYLDMSDVAFDSIDGIALFSGDAGGAAVVNGGVVNVQFTSPNGTLGTNADYPLLTVALTLSKNAIPGQTFQVNLNPAASVWQDLLGSPIAFEFKQGSLKVGGSVSITNVVPGGGTLPGGGVFSIFGTGFTPNTKVSIRELNASSVQYVSPTEFRVTLREAGTLDGALIQVQNPDNSSDSYYSYMRGVPVGQTTVPLLARTVPVFSLSTAFEAILPPTISSQVNADYFTAIALQNPNGVPAVITIESHSAGGAVTGSTTVTLAPGARISREAAELLVSVLPTGSYLRIVSAEPVQMLGLLGNNRTGVVLPISVNVLRAPAPPPAPPQSPSGGGNGGSGGGKGN